MVDSKRIAELQAEIESLRNQLQVKDDYISMLEYLVDC